VTRCSKRKKSCSNEGISDHILERHVHVNIDAEGRDAETVPRSKPLPRRIFPARGR
jgi:hypothetical protein